MTTASTKTTIVILWEHELRIAAKALHKLRSKAATQEDFSDAMKACFSAIYHPELIKNAPVTIMSAAKHPKEEVRINE